MLYMNISFRRGLLVDDFYMQVERRFLISSFFHVIFEDVF